MPLTDLKTIIAYLKGLDALGKDNYSEVVKVVKLILVIPATNALSERSFSALRRISHTYILKWISQIELPVHDTSCT